MAPHSQKSMPIVLVVSSDWMLRTMVRAELREANIEALAMQATSDMADGLAHGVVSSLIVVDGAELKNAAALEVLASESAVRFRIILWPAVLPLFCLRG